MAERLVMALAGAAAEDAVLGSVSTAADDDIGRATGIARLMVGGCGISEALRRVQVLASGPGSGTDDGSSLEAVSPATVEAFEADVRRLIEAAEARAKAIVGENRGHLDAMVARLESEEILERDALAQLLGLVAAAPAPPPDRHRQRLTATHPPSSMATAAAPGLAEASGRTQTRVLITRLRAKGSQAWKVGVFAITYQATGLIASWSSGRDGYL